MVRTALTFSFVLLASVTGAQYVELDARLQDAPPARVLAEISSSPIANESEIAATLKDGSYDEAQKADILRAVVKMRSRLEGGRSAPPAPPALVKEIKSSPLYRDPGVQETSNWLSRALARLKNIKFDINPPSTKMPTFSFLGSWLYYVMWFLIALAISILLFLGVKHLRWMKRLERSSTALLEDSEPERTLDEWLQQADLLEAEGKYREAVRALYLACLLRFDQERVARFDRSETNWEHLARIESSPKKPQDLDFRTPTKLFDRVWYGRIVRGREDSQQFRQWYVEITNILRRKAA